ncbi:MAG TPA: nucleotidyl transferase AbiEii/AbiGii toxin family protein [Clostridiales bacterium]|nr:nucleotidyl transferase AbiEii/AbiGii toxin family protein [Clostridiales bacterium]
MKINSDKFDPEFLDSLKIIIEVTDNLSIPFILIGASARDIIFEHMHGISAPRVTMDIDIAVEIAAWASFDQIKNELLNNYGFETTRQLQRFRYKDFFLDIVPFGKLAENGKIVWRENQNTMTVTGFNEIYDSAQPITVNTDPATEFKIPTLEGLMILKFISWYDAFPDRPKDAEDILFILNNYEKTLDIGEVFEKYPDVIENQAFDLSDAGLIILGSGMKATAGGDAFRIINDILIKETDEYGNFDLTVQMKGDIYRSLKMLRKLHEGMK